MKYLLLTLTIIVTGCSPEKKVQKHQFVFDKWSGYSAECCGWNGIVCKECE